VTGLGIGKRHAATAASTHRIGANPESFPVIQYDLISNLDHTIRIADTSAFEIMSEIGFRNSESDRYAVWYATNFFSPIRQK
jgi:hypothetical protein